jgi:hypothetical protein
METLGQGLGRTLQMSVIESTTERVVMTMPVTLKSEQRVEDQREVKILRRYLSVLQACGVRNYSWENLVRDYKIGLIAWLLMPVQDRFSGSSKDYWWPKMQCLVAAFRDWHCEELLERTKES